MNRTYAMHWDKSIGGTYSLIIEEDGGCPAFVAEIWRVVELNLFFVDIEPALNPDGEADPLDGIVGEAETIWEAKAAVKKWFLDTWGLEKAHRMYFEQQSIDWAEANQESVRVGAHWWKRDDEGNLIFRLAIPSGDASAVVDAGMVYTVDDTWVGVSAPPYGVPQASLFPTKDEAKAAVEAAVQGGRV